MSGFCQEKKQLTLQEAYVLLENNYPALQSKNLLNKIYELDIAHLEIATKPTLQLKGEGRIQSEAPGLKAEGLPISVDLPLYNIKTYADAHYTIYDGGRNEALKAQKAAQLNAELHTYEVEKFKLRARINNLFIATLLNRQQAKLLDITLDDLAARKKLVAAGVQYGTILESEVSKIEVRILEIEREKANLLFSEAALLASLEYLIGFDLAADVQLTLPNMPDYQSFPAINRPEQLLFQKQKEAILAQEQWITANQKPIVSAFAQAGIGYPNQLNFFEKKLAPYAIAGVAFRWNITDWDKEKNDRALLSLKTQQLDYQQATLEFNINAANGKYVADIKRLQEQIKIDQQIADLQADILNQLAAQLDNGVITSTDYLTQTNAELLARQQLELHQLQLLQTQLNFLNERGDWFLVMSKK
jgi:outer membrane protein TolC